MYLPIHAFAESLQDNTNIALPSIPEVTNSSHQIFSSDKAYTQLFLKISINSNISTDLISVRQDQDGKIYIRARDLKVLRVKMDEHTPDSQWVCINELKGIQFKYLENEQALNLQVPSNMLADYSVDLNGQQITSPHLLKMKPLNAAILNYSLYHTLTNDENVFSGSAEGIFNSA
ncbi:fimbrial biogenesis outer membrane usher protein, partial [Acinetobacter sp. V91_7]|nr:fimbrial biogenesis outer membrane usher protein [Acinetobacter sp. V91_4B]MDS7963845.1 fimbrial biogenesis outer membrane usher protein [Acinetobacter sp. V91_7]MDS8028526.1 fimbrial biogenesis outer membrane usher protein [Acinetobacter sp. V91_13]